MTPARPHVVVVAAGPDAPLAAIVASCRELGELAATEVWTPLGAPTWLHRALPRTPFVTRRPPGDRLAPAMLAAELGLRAWTRDHTDRRYLASFAVRAAIDAWAAREVTRRRPRLVIASSLAARRTFAAARAIGAACVLVLDLPLLRALHRDLDRAAAAWPERAFLRRFRAPSWAIARQEAERVLADRIVVRGAYAHALCLGDGIPASRLAVLPPATRQVPTPTTPTRRLRLAGLAAARHGIDTALAAARALGMTLVVRTGEGTEPADLARLPGVATDDGPVDAIVCPAVCETYAPELAVTGIPVIASAMASRDGRGPDPYDPLAFAAAIRSALDRGSMLADVPPTPLAAVLAPLVA
jgi:hypothetical protein